MNTPAIVLDGHLTKSALSCARSLGSKGVLVSCGSVRTTAPACHSRFVARRFTYASPKARPEAFIDDVLREATELFKHTGKKPVIFSFSDATSLLLARFRDQLSESCVLLLPPQASIETASDKEATYVLAQQLSIPTIRTYELADLSELAYPAIVKNRHSIVWVEGKSVSGSAEFVFTEDELRAAHARVAHESGEAPLVQEFITGGEYGIEMVCAEGEPLAIFAHKRIRSMSPRGGAAVVKETATETESIALMRTYAQALARALSWHGPIMVEFKVDARNGSVLLMEVNGRFWGSLPLAVKAGVDFPTIAYGLATNHMSDFVSRSYGFVRTRHFLGDCKWLWQVLFSRDPLRKTLYPSRLKALWDFKTEIFRSTGDVFLLSDPMPSIFEYADILEKWRSKA